jgi:hypothetical protein
MLLPWVQQRFESVGFIENCCKCKHHLLGIYVDSLIIRCSLVIFGFFWFLQFYSSLIV